MRDGPEGRQTAGDGQSDRQTDRRQTDRQKQVKRDRENKT